MSQFSSQTGIKIGIIGAGRAAAHYALPGLRTCPQSRVTAIASRSAGNARALAAQVEGSPPPVIYESWQVMLRNQALDAIVICTPPSTHFEMARQALENGLHVMVEKPAVISENEGTRLVKLSDKAGKFVGVHQPLRFSSPILAAKAILGRNGIGDIKSIETAFAHSGPGKDWFYDFSLAGGGVLLDLGIHLTDTIRFLLDDEFDEFSISEITYAAGHPAIETSASAAFKTHHGIPGTLLTSWVAQKQTGRLKIIGTKGSIETCFRPRGFESVVIQKPAASESVALINYSCPNAFQYFAGIISGEIPKDHVGIGLANNLKSLLPILALRVV